MSKAKLRQCPSCHGAGGWVDVILDDGTGPFEQCGFCQGTGALKGRDYYVVLGYLSSAARARKKWKKRRKR